MNKVTVIGSGRVGSTIAYSLTCRGLADEIVMIDINGDRAMGEALDIRQGLSYDSACKVYAGNYDDAENSDIVIITSGIARKPGQSRLELIKTNIEIQKSIIPEITKHAPNAVYIIVSNPADILTYSFCRLSGVPENRVIGSGTIIDTARLRSRIADYCGLEVGNVHAYMFGEHGDSGFCPWSIARIAGMPVDEYQKAVESSDFFTTQIDIPEIEKYVRESGARVISRKGATFYAIASTVCYIVKAVFTNANVALSVASMMHGEYGVEDVCLSTLNIVGRDGIRGKVNPRLTDEEVGKLQHSASVLKEIISQIDLTI
ncbi:MAG: L-lactate dehydrogenase [Clostridia bacterium]|nr:L-lactate dehydrogenase [Clostridia bacterium]MDY2714983.1 L-lactate dehydrogenase [Christensenellaceae bacterium]MDY3723742.1 L-lactate dehydrogenase [Christensenellaceae bacterium]